MLPVGIAVITSVVMGAITKALAEAAALAKEAQSAAISNMGTQMSNVEVSGSYCTVFIHAGAACARAALAIHIFSKIIYKFYENCTLTLKFIFRLLLKSPSSEDASPAAIAAATRRKKIRSHVLTLTWLVAHVSVVAILFSWLEGVSMIDGYYSAGQTLTTVGYGE